MSSSRSTHAFTLLEILLVILVVGITVAAFLPVALNTADQARTRSFLRQVISLNRYARSRAVLDRTEMAIVYDLEEGHVRLIETRPISPEPEFTEKDSEEGTGSDSGVLLERRVPDTMRIRSVEGGMEKKEGEFWVVMDVDGVGRTHTVEVVDPRGEIRTLTFNGFTGEVDRVN